MSGPVRSREPGEVPRVVVVILVRDSVEVTIRCLESLARGRGTTFQVLLWDNGSREPAADAVRARFPWLHLRRSESNLGVASGRNAAAEVAIAELGATHILFLDTDMEVEPNFVAALLRPFGEDPTVCVTQAKIRFLDDPLRINDAGGSRISFWRGSTTPVGYGELDQGQYDTRRPCIACGGATLVSAAVFRSVGGFDPIFNPYGPEDLDFSLRVSATGGRVMFVPEALTLHAHSRSITGEYTAEYARLKARNWLRFLRRHGSFAQRVGFYLFGAPVAAARMVVRKGGAGVLSGALRGALRSRSGKGKEGSSGQVK
jgi:GT2 family glycosyltransferase